MLNFFRAHQDTDQDPPALATVAAQWSPPAVAAPEAIIDVGRLYDQMPAPGDSKGIEGRRDNRAILLDLLKHARKEGEGEIRRRFLEDLGTGDDCVAERTYLMDHLLRTLADITVGQFYPNHNPTTGERLAIVALGGYGRGDLAPESDIDLLFLLPYKRTPTTEQIVESMLYLLWDMGLKVGHAVRSVDECIRSARADVTICTSLLESRMIWGHSELFATLMERFAKEIVAAGDATDFVEAKLAERDARHRKLGDSRYVMEPNVKDGKGGLRDLQTLFWIAKYLYKVPDMDSIVEVNVLAQEELERFRKAQAFLRTVRCHLHYLTGRCEDRLTFDVQREIGPIMGYTDHAGASGVERFMKHYFLIAKDVGDLTRIFCAALEAESQRKPRRLFHILTRSRSVEGFPVDYERLNVRDERHFRDHPVDMLRLFRVAQTNDLDIHPNALRLITRSLRLINNKLRTEPEANRLFLEILSASADPEPTLRRMNEAGVLSRFVPEFGRVVAQMQYDMYHVYTVDEHTLFAIGILHRIMSGGLEEELPLATKAAGLIQSNRALAVAVLLHDVAKGRGGDHSVLGAKVARKVCPRLGLSEEETETIEWLIRHHLLMSDTALKRDLEDDQTIRDFVQHVTSMERLRLLLVLTTADIRAVGPGRWNAWKGTLLAQLFHRAYALIADGFEFEGTDLRVKTAQEAVRRHLPNWTPAAIEAFLAKGYPPYWLSLDTETLARHATLVDRVERENLPVLVDARVLDDQSSTEITILTQDHPGLFSRVAGALAVVGANILEAKIFTLTTGLAIDVFNIQDSTRGGRFTTPDTLEALNKAVRKSLAGTMEPAAELARQRSSLPSRTRVFQVQPRVMIDNQASRTHSVIEVNGRDRPGLLYDLTRGLSDLSLQISSAKISTFGERAVDVFYVKDIFGLKVSHDSKLEQIRVTLLGILNEGEPCPHVPSSPTTRPSASMLFQRHRRSIGARSGRRRSSGSA